MKTIFLDNIFEEICGKQKKLSYIKSTSFIMDNFISNASPDNLSKYFEEISDELIEMSNGQCSCHVVEKALTRFVYLLHISTVSDMEALNKIKKCLMKWKKELCNTETLVEFICGNYSTHVARSYFQALCGVVLPAEDYGNTNSFEQKDIISVTLDDQKVDEKLLKCFKVLISLFCKMDKKTSIETLTNVYGSPCVSILLILARRRSIKSLNLLSNLIISPSSSSLLSSSKQLMLLSKDKIGSRVIETLMNVGSKEACVGFYEEVFADDTLVEMACHSNANFIVQRMMSSRFLQFKQRFSRIFSTLTENLEIIFQSKNMGVIQKIVDQCLIKIDYQDKMMKALQELFNCHLKENEDYLTYLIATSTKLKSPEDEILSRSISYHGSLLVQSLLKFQSIDLIVSGFMRLSEENICKFSCSAAGSHLIDAFLSSARVDKKTKDQFTDFISENSLASIACDKYGSRVIENIWKLSSLARKTALVESLAQNGEKISEDRFGRHIYRKFGIRLYLSRPDRWNEYYKKEQSKKRSINDSSSESKKSKKN